MHEPYLELTRPGITLDARRMDLTPQWLIQRAPAVDAARAEMTELVAGAIANPDEGRMVGHYWLRDSAIAPSRDISHSIDAARAAVIGFVEQLGGRFGHVLHVGVGGSALGPQLIVDAVGGSARRVTFIDNTDPAGVARVVASSPLDDTLVVVVSKSGRTPETRNGYLAVRAAYEAAGLDFGAHAVAVTGEGSELDREAEAGGWLARFPMWDWVGGRTSVTSAVGLVPLALSGGDVDGFLAGARAADETFDTPFDAALLLALCWLRATDGAARRAMVVLPYRDRLGLLARYLQQLVMESLGKAMDRDGAAVHQGLTVYGNKGSTDQHAYVQQLREGPDDFFAVLVEVLDDGAPDVEVDEGVTMGDHLSGFLAGTRQALTEAGRLVLTVTLDRLDAASLGGLIALHERAVGLYASFVNVNAYHQPGVEAGKKAAKGVLGLQARLVDALRAGASGTAAELAATLDADPDLAFHVLRRLAATGRATSAGLGLGRRFEGAQ